MSTVANKAVPGSIVDPSFCTHGRVVTADPNGTTTPEFAGEIVLDTTGKKRWIAKAMTNTSWVEYSDTHTV